MRRHRVIGRPPKRWESGRTSVWRRADGSRLARRRFFVRQRAGAGGNAGLNGREVAAVEPSADECSDQERLRRLEGILFAAREPLHSRKLAELAGLADGTAARTLIKQLSVRYDQGQRAFQIRQVAEGFQMVTRPQFAEWLRRWGRAHRPDIALSPPALETLAVVAYRQPINKAEIEAIRGVRCAEMLRQLMERELVRITGRGSELGRPYLYGTTRFFLQTFGFPSLDSLPQAGQLRGTGLPTWFRSLETLESTPKPTEELEGHSEELNVRLSAPNTVDELDSQHALDPLGFGSELLELREFAALEVRNADELDEDLGDEDVEVDDEEEDDFEDDEEEDDEEEEEFDDEDFEDEDWEEVEDDEDWEDEDEDDEEEDDDWDDEEDGEAEEEEEEEEWE